MTLKISKKWFFLVVLLLVGGGTYYYFKTRKAKTTFTETVVKRGDLSISILATGTVSPENRLEIKAPIAGRAEKVLVVEGQRLKKGQVIAWMSSTERAALLDAARSKDKAEVKKWEDLYRPTPIMAPIDGMLIYRNVEPGQTFTSADAILVMSDRLTVKALVDETDIGKIQLKQGAQIVLDAYADKKIEASVDQIAYEAKTVSNVTSYQVDVLPKKAQDYMRSGMTANVTFYGDSKKDALLVSNDSLKVKDGAFYVWIKGADGKKEERPIKLGLSDGKQTEVVEGLQENDIILSSEFALSDGKKGTNPFSPMGGMKGPRTSNRKTN